MSNTRPVAKSSPPGLANVALAQSFSWNLVDLHSAISGSHSLLPCPAVTCKHKRDYFSPTTNRSLHTLRVGTYLQNLRERTFSLQGEEELPT